MTIISSINRFKFRFACTEFFKKFIVMNKINKETKTKSDVSTQRVNNTKSVIKNGAQFEVLTTPVKSESDKKDYKVIRLKNGLTACLISDTSPISEDEEECEAEEESEGSDEDSGSEEEGSDSDDDEEEDSKKMQKMAAASLCVNVGSFSDPKSVPGMAHFLEHMVFMGSEKFPAENDFDSFLSNRGGSDNASTDCEQTTFYFECLERDLHAALDKFAQFFISPLMKRGSITREREAIDSEFQMALPSDSYRKEQLLASFACPESPVNTFTWGNLITLKDNISEDELYEGVHEFRKRHYSAHRMALAIQARLPLEDLEKFVVDCFKDIPSNDLDGDDFTIFKNVFDTPAFTKMYYVEPVDDIIQLDLTWALPSLLDQYKSKPHQYISWLLGYEGKGSLLSYLKAKVWGLSLTAGNGESGSEHNSIYATFTISMTLTQEGFNQIDNIIEAVFSYINMLKSVGPQERLFNEMKLINYNSFKFAPEESSSDYVETISESMHLYPPEHYLTGPKLFYNFDPKGIEKVLDSFVPEKMNILVLTNKLPNNLAFDKTEKWFGTKYTEQEITPLLLKKWQKVKPFKEFYIPPPNIFLTENFSLLAEDKNHPDYPQKVVSTELLEMWYRKDQKFKLPVAYFNFYLINPVVVASPKSAALMDFYMNAVQLLLDEEAYGAQAAHLNYAFSSYDKGLLISVNGYNEKLHLLIDLIAHHCIDFKNNLSEDMFKAVKDKLIRFYYNRLIKPGTLATDIRLDILIHNHQSLIQKYNASTTLTYKDVITFAETFLGKVFIKALVQGNVEQSHAIDVLNKFVKSLNCKALDPSEYPKVRVTQIPEGETFCVLNSFNTNDTNSIIANYYQAGKYTLKDSVIIELLMLIIGEPLFDTLRTKEQLGYDVRCSDRDTFGILGFTITVNSQATKNTSEHVDNRIEEFVKEASNLLATMTEDAFNAIKLDFIKAKRCVDVELNEEVKWNWYEIIDEDYLFDRKKQEIELIEKLTQEEVRKWWEEYTKWDSKGNYRKLSVQVCGSKNSNSDTKKEEITDEQDQNKKLQLNFTDCDCNEAKPGDQKKTYVKDIGAFKETLFLYPCMNNYTIGKG